MNTVETSQNSVKIVINPDHNYCERCGLPTTLQKVKKSRRFDEKTGKEVLENEKVCRNPTCQVGCGNVTGHRWGFLRQFFVLGCKHCGLFPGL